LAAIERPFMMILVKRVTAAFKKYQASSKWWMV
jgi:hypothetical protein